MTRPPHQEPGTTRCLPAIVATVLFAGFVIAIPLHAGETAHQPSTNLFKPLHQAQDDIRAKKYAEAIAKLKEAEGISGKTPYDQHLINDMLAFSYIKANDYAEAAKAMQAEIDDGFTPQSDIPQKVRAIAEINYQLKNYDKAIDFGNRAIKSGYGNDQIDTLVGQAYYLKGDWKGTLKFQENVIDSQVKRGLTPTKTALLLYYSSCVRLNDSLCSAKAWQEVTRFYPEIGRWAQRPERRDSPIRAENLTDDEAREIQRLMLDIMPGVILNIGTVVAGCACGDGPSCSAQVWVVGHRPGTTAGLMLSKINSRWTVGPVQRWWLDLDDLEARRPSLSSQSYLAAEEALRKSAPTCSAATAASN
jgi:tetratricopeptide (TPR) repeat protein